MAVELSVNHWATDSLKKCVNLVHDLYDSCNFDHKSYDSMNYVNQTYVNHRSKTKPI
jgi:hypothetical protein